MPTPLQRLSDFLSETNWYDFGWSLLLIAAALAGGAALAAFVFHGIERWARRTETPVDDTVVRHLRQPLRWLLPVFALRTVLPLVVLTPEAIAFLRQCLLITLILLAGWLAMRTVRTLEELVKLRFDITAPDNVTARSVHTQIRGFHNIATFVITLLCGAFVLMSFEAVRQFGVTVLASAGVAGVIVGFAAQRSIATVVAGIQIALTQPIRVNDVVIVEGEWGWIEDITLTYVVVRIWDLRRLVVPITHFIEKPFQNWTRLSPELVGTVFLYVDYSIPVDAVRAELKRILDASPLWNQKSWGLQVTNANDRAVELRAVVSASDAGKLWELRCTVREKLIAYLQSHHPGALPRVRAELNTESTQEALPRALPDTPA